MNTKITSNGKASIPEFKAQDLVCDKSGNLIVLCTKTAEWGEVLFSGMEMIDKNSSITVKKGAQTFRKGEFVNYIGKIIMESNL